MSQIGGVGCAMRASAFRKRMLPGRSRGMVSVLGVSSLTLALIVILSQADIGLSGTRSLSGKGFYLCELCGPLCLCGENCLGKAPPQSHRETTEFFFRQIPISFGIGAPLVANASDRSNKFAPGVAQRLA